MEDVNFFWNNITELLESLGMSYVTKTEAMLILLAALLIVLALLWFVFRRARLWYWKTNIQIETLKSIDLHLKNVEEKITLSRMKIIEETDKEMQLKIKKIDLSDQDMKMENTAPDGETQTAVGKSGRIYTEAELELQIRD